MSLIRLFEALLSRRKSTRFFVSPHVLLFLVLSLNPLALLPLAKAAPPSSIYDLPKIVAVQNREYVLEHGLDFHMGFLPSDAFNKGVIFGSRYMYYFTDYLGWEVVNANYSFNIETDLRKDLVENFPVELENAGFGGQLDYVEYYLTSSLVYTPLYNKNLLFNKSVVYGETSLLAGGGIAFFNETGSRLLITLGLLQRFFLTRKTSWTVEFRDNIHLDPSTGANHLLELTVGYTFQLGEKNSESANSQGKQSQP